MKNKLQSECGSCLFNSAFVSVPLAWWLDIDFSCRHNTPNCRHSFSCTSLSMNTLFSVFLIFSANSELRLQLRSKELLLFIPNNWRISYSVQSDAWNWFEALAGDTILFIAPSHFEWMSAARHMHSKREQNIQHTRTFECRSPVCDIGIALRKHKYKQTHKTQRRAHVHQTLHAAIVIQNK